MDEIRRQFIAGTNNYKNLRRELLDDNSLTEAEKDWLLEQFRRSTDHQSQLLELELY